ncbi:MAG: EAL domain-containing protein [Deltaproteobacteria bacterium]|nr:EAL domain-containing protein [Deltaproteobacteria bacterium]
MKERRTLVKMKENIQSDKRILVIDDEEHARMIMGDFLEDAGFEVLGAENGREGLHLLQKERPDAVLTDIRMPVMDGLKVVEVMKKIAPLTPVIIVSGTGAMENVISALRLGAWDYILKPVKDLKILAHTLHKALERARYLNLEKNYRNQLEKEVEEKTTELRSEILAREIAQKKLEFEAYHDPLTRIGNRLLCMKDLSKTAPFTRKSKPFGFLLFDVDSLKDINDAYGYSFGDRLLIEVGERLSMFFKTGKNFYRMGGDEFSVFLQGATRNDVIAIAQNLLEWLSRPYSIEKETINVSFTCGLSLLLHGNGHDLQKPINEATFAHRQAKRNFSDRIVIYDDTLHRNHLRRLSLEKEMCTGLALGEFSLVYQPIINHKEKKIQGFEGLLRWDSRKFGAVSPEEFIPIAEESGFIAELGEWAVENACRFWAERGLQQQNITLAMNISGKQFFQQGLVEKFRRIMEVTQFDPSKFCLEITESALMANIAETIKKLQQFKELGIRISIDDFGTGYSSLEYLHRFPADTLKIDMSFVQKIDQDPKTHELIQVMKNMASVFDLELVAEGVETKAQQEMLLNLGCHLQQGYLYSRPVVGEMVRDLGQRTQYAV